MKQGSQNFKYYAKKKNVNLAMGTTATIGQVFLWSLVVQCFVRGVRCY